MKFFRKIHLWLSVPFGIIITLICFSGAMLIFEPEITRSVKSDVYYVSSVEQQTLPMGELMETVKATLPDSVAITGVTVFNDPERTYQVNLSKPRRSSLFINQYTGEITGKYERLGFFSTMFKLHRWLLDSANPHGEGLKVGKLLVGISTLIFVIALISGVVIWWPRARKNLRKAITISFSKGWKGFWKGLHVAGGMYALIFVLAMSLTGLTWSFDWYRSAFYAVCGVEHTPRNFAQNTPSEKKNGERGENRHGNGEGRPDGEFRHGNGEGRPDGEFRRGNGEGRPDGEFRRGNGEGRPDGEFRRGNGEGRPDGEFRRGNGEGRPDGEFRHGNGEGRPDGEFRHGNGEGHINGEFRGGNGEGRRGGRRSEFGRWQQVYDELKANNPDAPQITIGQESATVTLGTTGNPRAADKYEFNRRSGEITPATLYADTKEADKLRGWIYAIHTGALGGIFTRILWLLGALLGASLPLTGYYIWIKHLTNKKHKGQHHDDKH